MIHSVDNLTVDKSVERDLQAYLVTPTKEPVVSTLKTPIRQRLNYQSESEDEVDVEVGENQSKFNFLEQNLSRLFQALHFTRQNFASI